MYVSFMVPILFVLIIIFFIWSIASISEKVKYSFVLVILTCVFCACLLLINLDHPIKTNIVEEKVFIINNRAVTETSTEINSILNKNFKDGDIVYKVEYLPYWHRFAYWFRDGKNDYEYLLEDPRIKNESF